MLQTIRKIMALEVVQIRPLAEIIVLAQARSCRVRKLDYSVSQSASSDCRIVSK